MEQGTVCMSPTVAPGMKQVLHRELLSLSMLVLEVTGLCAKTAFLRSRGLGILGKWRFLCCKPGVRKEQRHLKQHSGPTASRTRLCTVRQAPGHFNPGQLDETLSPLCSFMPSVIRTLPSLLKHSRYHTPMITSTLSVGITAEGGKNLSLTLRQSLLIGDALDSAQLCSSPCLQRKSEQAGTPLPASSQPLKTVGAESSEPCQPLWGHESSMKLQSQHAAAVTGLPGSIAYSPRASSGSWRPPLNVARRLQVLVTMRVLEVGTCGLSATGVGDPWTAPRC